MRRFMMFLLIVSICLILLYVNAEEQNPEVFTSGNWDYIVLEDGTAEVTRYNDNSVKEVFIPDLLDGKPVTSIGDKTFEPFFNNKLISVSIPDSVVSIRVNSFNSSNSMQKFLVSPNNSALAVMDNVLFSKADKRLVCYPRGLLDEKYEIPQGIQIIGEKAFFWTWRLKEVIIPDSVTVIENYAFSGSHQIVSLTIPDSVRSIGNYAFYGCLNLRSIELPHHLTKIGNGMFCDCQNLYKITIPESVTEIGNRAFANCASYLSSITIPEKVTSLGSNPFSGCKCLRNIEVSPGNPVLEVVDGVLFSKPDRILVCYPAGLKDELYSAPQGTAIIGDYAFNGCDHITTVILPEGVSRIGSNAFSYCLGLTSISIPEGVTEIGDYAFMMCQALTSLTIPDSVTRIGNKAFNYCSSLTCIVGHNSYAAQYCQENGINYTYPDSNDWLSD